MIPPVDPVTGNLPPGIHDADWTEIVTRYAFTPRRRELLAGLRAALDLLHSFGCRTFYLDGSFVSATETPGDNDGCWEIDGVDIYRLAREATLLWDDSAGRPNQKRQFGGDLFPVRAAGDALDRRVLDDSQRDADTREPKGIVRLDLGTLP